MRCDEALDCGECPARFGRRWLSVFLVMAAGVLSHGRSPAADDGFVVLADSGDGPAIALPSPASRLESFEAVEEAIARDQARIAELEKRLKELEKPAKETKEAGSDKAGSDKGEPKKPNDGQKKEKENKGPEPVAVGSDLSLKPSWSSGLRFESPNKDFGVKVGGRTQLDATSFTSGPGPDQSPGRAGLNPTLADTVNFRRARLRVEGRMYEVYDWAAEYDFVNEINVNNEVFPNERDAGPLTAVTDLWMQIRELPVLGIVRIGNQKDPYGFEHLTSSRWLNFMERSFSQDAFEGPFNNGFLPGIQALNNAYDGRLAWQVGQFKNTNNPFGFSSTSGGSMTVGRIVYLPVFEDEGRQLVHLGLSGRTMEPQRRAPVYNNITGDPTGPTLPYTRFRSRGSIRNGPPGPLNSIYADSGLINAEWQNMIGLEFAANNGPWSFQSEYFGSWLYDARLPSVPADGFKNNPGTSGQQPAPGTSLGTVYYQGGYAEVLYFLTGESRTYSLIESRFDRPVPRNNFYIVRNGGHRRGWSISEGAWQVGARYNYLCLSDGEVNGGVLNGMTLGLNWLMTPNSRVYFNYDFTYRDFVNANNVNGSGCIHGFGTRFAFDF